MDERWTSRVTRGKTATGRWIACGWPKNLQIPGRTLLCCTTSGSRTAPTTEGGPSGGNPGTPGKPGSRRSGRVPVTGGVPGSGSLAGGSRATGHYRRGRAQPGNARPLHLIHGGASSYCARHRQFFPRPTRRNQAGAGRGARAGAGRGHGPGGTSAGRRRRAGGATHAAARQDQRGPGGRRPAYAAARQAGPGARRARRGQWAAPAPSACQARTPSRHTALTSGTPGR